MTQEELLALVDHAFGASPRPEHFTNFTHCSECAEYDALLCSRDRLTIGLDDVAEPASDPMTFATPAGFAYYMPALARLALGARDDVSGFCWYAEQFVGHFWNAGHCNKHLRSFDATQRAAVIAFAEFLIDDPGCARFAETLLQVHDFWSDGPMGDGPSGD